MVRLCDHYSYERDGLSIQVMGSGPVWLAAWMSDHVLVVQESEDTAAVVFLVLVRERESY